jgi:hypothetical protein
MRSGRHPFAMRLVADGLPAASAPHGRTGEVLFWEIKLHQLHFDYAFTLATAFVPPRAHGTPALGLRRMVRPTRPRPIHWRTTELLFLENSLLQLHFNYPPSSAAWMGVTPFS